MSQLAYEKTLKAKLEENPFYTLEKAVYEILLESIVTFKIAPGMKLVEYQLAEAFGISRSPIREALHLLEEQGFVRKQHNTKIIVAPLDKKEYNELIQFRCILEPAAVGIASLAMTENDLKKVKKYADLLNEAWKKGDFALSLKYENLFHEFIIQCCHNQYIINAYKSIQPYLTRSRAAYLYLNKEHGPNICVEEHYLIYNSLVLRNKDLVENIFRHLLQMLLMPSDEDGAEGAENDHPYDAILRQEKNILSSLAEMNQKQKREKSDPAV